MSEQKPPEKVILVIDEHDEIIEKVSATGTNSTQQRELEKATKKRYTDQGIQVKIRTGYVGISQEQYEATKKILQESFEKYPEMGHMFEKDRPEFRHLGYEIKPEFKYKNYKRKRNENH